MQDHGRNEISCDNHAGRQWNQKQHSNDIRVQFIGGGDHVLLDSHSVTMKLLSSLNWKPGRQLRRTVVWYVASVVLRFALRTLIDEQLTPDSQQQSHTYRLGEMFQRPSALWNYKQSWVLFGSQLARPTHCKSVLQFHARVATSMHAHIFHDENNNDIWSTLTWN
jgi:hypothetical protein